jgi:hypothetical protein
LNSIIRLGAVASPFSSGNPADIGKKECKMAWTATNLVIQIIFGILGGHAAAAATKEHSFGALGHTIVGAIGGGLSGCFLQTIAGTLVTGTGDVMASNPVEQAVIQGLTGAVAGGIAVLAVGMIKLGIDNYKASNH